MTTADELLAELQQVASAVGPAVAPRGSAGLLQSLTETARRLFGAAACSLALLSEDEDELVFTTASGGGDITGLRMPATQGLAGWVVASGQAVAVSDVAQDPRFARDVAEQTGYLPAEVLAVPVQTQDRLFGVLQLLDRDADRPGSAQDIELLTLFADQAALALDSARAFTDLGRELLLALAEAAGSGTPLVEAVARTRAAAEPTDPALRELAALFGDLAQQGPAERDLALRVLRQFTAYTRGRSARPGA